MEEPFSQWLWLMINRYTSYNYGGLGCGAELYRCECNYDRPYVRSIVGRMAGNSGVVAPSGESITSD